MASAEEVEIWECPICVCPLESPTQLPCGGVFCLCHLEDFVDGESGELDCPGCLGHHKIPHEGLSGFRQLDQLFEDLEVFERESDELREIGENMRITTEEHREKVQKDIDNINHGFDKVIERVNSRRCKVLIPYKAELSKLRQFENYICDITNLPQNQQPDNEDDILVALRQAQRSMTDKIRMAEIDLTKLKEQLNTQIHKWDDMWGITFKAQIKQLYDLINSFGQIDHYVNYKIKSKVDVDDDDHRFLYPRHLAICPSTDNVYITCRYAILQVNNEGRFIKETTMDYVPYGIAVDSNRRIIVTDCENHKFHIYDHNLTLIKSFGKKGSKNGQFQYPLGVVCDVDGNIYIVDYFEYRIQVFTSKGKFILKFGVKKQIYSRYLHISPDQKLLIADLNNNTVYVYKLTGEYEREFGRGLLKWPRGICTDVRGYILVADLGNKTIEVFTPDCIHFTTMNNNNGVFNDMWGNIAITKAGSVFVAERTGDKLHVLH